MSVSVDDLVASFSSNHIGQEALDLAALQAQLAQTLHHQALRPSLAVAPEHGYRPHTCNTPTASTPAASASAFSWGQAMAGLDDPRAHRRHRSGSVASVGYAPVQAFAYADDEDMQDEAMVEDLLGASAPASPIAPATQAPWARDAHDPGAGAGASAFATSDPFYLAALQAAQAPAPPLGAGLGFFAQAGRPAASSPFVAPHAHAHAHAQRQFHAHQYQYAHAPPAAAHPVFVGAPSFGR